MESLAFSVLSQRLWYVILGIAGLLVVLGVEVCIPTCTEQGTRTRTCETVQVHLREGMAWCGNRGGWQLRGLDTFPFTRIAHRDQGRTLLHYAVAANSRAGTWLLVTLGANRNARTVQDSTPLHYAWGEQSAGAVKVLLRHGADPNARDVWDNTTLHNYGGHAPIVTSLLLQHGADPNARNADGHTPLHVTINPESARLLLRHGADPNARSVSGHTPLHTTINPAVASLLLCYGADPDLRDEKGLSPLDMAVIQARLEVAAVLRGQVECTAVEKPVSIRSGRQSFAAGPHARA